MRITSNLRKGFAVFTGALLTMVCTIVPNIAGAVPHIMVPPQTDTLYTEPSNNLNIEIYEGDTDVNIPDTKKSVAVGYQGKTSSLSVDSDWTVLPDPEWVRTDLWSGQTINNGTKQSASLIYDVETLAPNTYTAQLTFFSDPAYVDSASLNINLTVKAAYEFGMNVNSIDTLTPVGTPGTSPLILSNATGSGREFPFTLAMADGSDFPSWLHLSATSGVLGSSPVTIQVTCDPEDRTIGDTEYVELLLSTTETRVVTNNIILPVRMTVISPEGEIRIVTRPTSLRAKSYEMDDAPVSKLQLSNLSVMNLSYMAETTGAMDMAVTPSTGLIETKSTVDVDCSFPNAKDLAAGIYDGQIEVTTTTVTPYDPPIIVPVSLEILPSWEIGVTPPADTFDQTVIFTRRAQTSFVVFNASRSNKEMDFTIESDVPWLKFTNRTGRVTNRNRVPVTVTYDSTGYEPGVYTGSFTIRGTSVQDPSRHVEATVEVSMTVVMPEPNELGDLQPSSFDVTIYETDNASTRRFNVVNPTSMLLDYKVETAPTPVWILKADPETGTVRNNTLTSVRLNFDTVTLTPGNYAGKVLVTTTSLEKYANFAKELPINLTVKPGFMIGTNKTAIEESIPKGDAFDGQVRVWNSASDKPMKYTVSTDVPWIQLTKTEGIVTWNSRNDVPYRLETTGLAGGIYEGYISISAESANYSGHPAVNNTVNIHVKIHVTNEPVVSTKVITQTVVSGAANPADKTFEIWNNRNDNMAFTITRSTVSKWFSVAPTYGLSSNPGDRKTIRVSFNTQGLQAGTYTGQIRVNVPSGNVIDTYITVILTVEPAREIGILPTTLSFTVPEGTEQTMDWKIWNQRPNDPMPYQLVVSSNWAKVSKSAGTVTDTPDLIQVTASAKDKVSGTYMSSVIIYADGAKNSPREVTIKMLVVEKSTIETDPADLLEFSVMEGATTTVPVMVRNAAGNVPMQFYMSTDCSWLSPKQVTAIAKADGISVSFVADTTGLKQGTYEGNIRLTVPNGSCSNSPYVLPVKMTVTGYPLNIALAPSSLTLSHYEYEVPQYAIAIWNDGVASEDSMPFSLVSTVRWLTVTPATGIATSAKQYFIITVNTLELLPGYTYTGSIVVTAPNASNSPRTLPVTLELKKR